MLGHERGQKEDAGPRWHVLERAGRMPEAVFLSTRSRGLEQKIEKVFFIKPCDTRFNTYNNDPKGGDLCELSVISVNSPTE